MDNCRIWLKGHCKEYKKGACDLVHIKDFCQDGIECKDKTCLEGFQKRHVIKCSKRQRWKNGDECQFPRKWKSCSFFHPELGKAKVKEKECKKCDENEKQLKALKSTIETMKNGSSTNSINLVSSENTSEQSMIDRITDNVLKKIRAEREEPDDEEKQMLKNEIEKLKTSRDNLEKEVKSVRRGLDNWKTEGKKMSEQIENNVDKKINNKLETLGKAKKELNDDVQPITLSIKQKVKDELTPELFKVNSPGRKCVQDEVEKSKKIILHNIENFLGIEFDDEDNLKDALMKNIRQEFGTDNLKEKLGIKNLIEAAVNKVKDDVTEYACSC